MVGKRAGKRKRILVSWILRMILIPLSAVMVYPLIWNLYSSFKTNTEFLEDAMKLPEHPMWSNYVQAITETNLGVSILNSIVIVLSSTAILALLTIPCTYCLVRYRFPGAKLILKVYMALLFIPDSSTLIQLFLVMRNLHLLNSRAALSLLYAATGVAFPIFLLSGFLSKIPRDYEEAAMIDGCGPFRILVNVVMPLARPGIVTVCMFSAIGSWNEYMTAMVMLTDEKKKTLAVAMAHLYEVQRYATDWGTLFAALVIALVSTLLIFMIGQKYIVQGMNIGGLKG